MERAAINLNLDEALISVNRTAISSNLEVYYQIDECTGCPLQKLKTLSGKIDDFVIGTKFTLQLELRKLGIGPNVAKCHFDDLSLNSHGLYSIEVTENAASSNLNCYMKTLDKGECWMCPFAILTCIMLAIFALETINTRFWQSRRQIHKKKVSLESGATLTSQSSQLDSNNLNDNSTNNHQTSDNATNTSSQIVINDFTSAETSHEIDLSGPNQQHQQRATDSLPQVVSSRSTNNVRVEALDAFRGLTIAGMIFVNYGGAGYVMLEHKPWDGITLADFVFPFFIFAMGASIAISTRSIIEKQKKTFQVAAMKIFRRSFLLASIGLCLNSKWLDYNTVNLNQLRLTGVLQRFAISYLVVALMYTIEITVNKWIKAQSIRHVPIFSKSIDVLFELLTAVNYTTIYIFVTFFFNYDSTCPIGYTGPGGLTDGGKYANCTGGAAAWLDRLILGEGHLYHGGDVKAIFKTEISHDPEGILGYTTSILLTLIGLQCGKILIYKPKNYQQDQHHSIHRKRLIAFGQWIVLLTLSCSLVVVIPVNKRLWSLTFVLTTGLAAFVLIVLLYLILDLQSSYRTLLMRLIISAGKNSIFLYVGHSILANMLPWWFPVDQSSHLWLLLRLTWSTFLWLLVAHYLALKKIFIKI